VTIGLRFDLSSSGQVEGINDAGIETFAGDHLGSLAREQGQNSLDAKRPGVKGPVEVTYQLLEIKTAELPAAADLAAAVVSAEKFWSEPGRNDEKTLQILKKAKSVLKGATVPLLRIADRNTTGLRGSNLYLQGDWFSLTKASGVSLKARGKGGSFGIGKNVFWGNSRLRTVFFSTTDMDGQSAFQGVVKLVSHPVGGDISRAVGFYGVIENYGPILKLKEIPAVFRCDDVGTDIFLAGFDPDPGWKDSLRAAFAENFFVAFHNDLLRVTIEKTEISAANIAEVVEDLAKRRPEDYSELKNYFDALTSSEAKVVEAQFPKLGKVQLRLLVRDGAQKRIAMFRGTGMRIVEKKGFRTPVEFAGVLLCDDEKGNDYLRDLEPPSHNDWQPERSPDPKQAAEVISALYAWVRRCVAELNPITMTDRLEVPGLEKYLPDDSDEIFDANAAKGEGDPKPPAPKVLEGKSRLPRPPVVPGLGGGGDDGKGRTKKKSKRGSGEDDGKPVDADFRIFKLPNSISYTMRFRIPYKGRFSVTLASVGDDGRAEHVNPLTAELVARPKPKKVRTSGSKIGPVLFGKGGIAEFRFDLASAVPLSLTARINEH
jgi:hypothetical protein